MIVRPVRWDLTLIPKFFLLLVSLAAGAALVASCRPGTEAITSGVEGLVLIGPMCPVVQAGQDCPDQPFEADLEIEDLTRDVIARGQADAEGQFRIPLDPGDYVLNLVPPNPGGPPTAAPIPFKVEEGVWTTLNVLVDSGIR